MQDWHLNANGTYDNLNAAGIQTAAEADILEHANA
jgi:hypothetical protein